MTFDASTHAKAIELTKLAIEMTTASGSGHPTSGASLAHLVTLLMYNQMRYDPADPANPASDRLVLSEGHAVPIIYAAAADLGVHLGVDPANRRPMTREDAMRLREIDSEIEGHPNPIEGFPFFDAATGSLGQGLSVAAGLAAAARLDGIKKRIYCLIGDGESREGQIWEAVDFIAEQNLTGVLPIFNCNHYAQSDAVAPQQSPETTAAKLEAVGFKVASIDGHSPAAIHAALAAHADLVANGQGKPMAIVARTIKGWGSPSAQGHGHHGAAIKGDAKDQALAELEQTAQDVGAKWTPGELQIPPVTEHAPRQGSGSGRALGFAEAMKQYGKEDVLQKGKWATRRAYGVALRALGHADPRVVALDGDVKNSTYSQEFHKDPALAERFFESRIAEQNMISTAAGLSAGGKIPFASSFAKFITRGYDQLEMAINSGVRLSVVGSHAGVSLAADGPSQMALPDVAWFHAWSTVTRRDGSPAAYLLQPADVWAAYALTLAMGEHDGVCYMRTLRPDVEFLYDEQARFTLGGHQTLREGRDLLILASGYMVHEAKRGLEQLREAGIDATLVDLYSLPFDAEAIREMARENNHRVLTLEDNYGGGFGSAVADALSANGESFTVNQMFVRRIPKSGKSPDDLMRYCGLSADDIVRTATGMMEMAAR